MSKSKSFGWPAAIVAAFVALAAGLVAFAIMATRDPMELVSRDYYDREIAHQRQIDSERRALAVSTGLVWRYDEGRKVLRIVPPGAGRGTTGKVKLYRPSNAALDREYELAPDDAGAQSIPLGDLAAGLWKVQITWNAGAGECFQEGALVTP